MKLTNKLLLLAFVLFAFAGNTYAKKKKKTASEPPKSAYQILTGRDSVKIDGVMNVIEKKDSLFLELPTSLLGREFLVVNKLQQVPKELNESGVNKGIVYQNQTIKFEWDKKRNAVVIRQKRVSPLVDKNDAIALSVEENYIDPILAVIKTKAIGTDSASVVFPVNKLFEGKDNCLNDVFNNINIPNSPNSELCRIISLKSHPNSVTAMSEQTAVVHEGTSRVNVTVVVSSTLFLLDEKPMEGRLETARIGYFTNDQLVYSDNQQQVKNNHYINRWRLVPTDKAAYMRGELVEPEKPIVFYVDKRIPASIRPYIKKGMEDWNVAFEKAGFKNAVQVREMTDSIELEGDDMRYSVLTYDASEKANAMGPAVVDPRSGEILEADIIWWHNVRKLLANWITVQTGATNPALQSFKVPDELIGDAARFVATHEVGHSLGLRHNMKASSAYPTDSLRSKTFTDRMGNTSPSIMDYARYNYIAQPGDGVTQFAPHIGAYDLLAIEWGYRWYPSEEEAKRPLAELLAKHTGKEYKYNENTNYRQALDPRALSEDLGDNSVKSAKYGIANLKRIVPNIEKWVRNDDPSQPWDDAAFLWNSIITQWDLYNYHVLANVGGMYLENTVMGDGQKTFGYVEKSRQKEAVQYLIDNVFTYPEWLFNPSIAQYTYLLKNGREEHPSTSLKNEQNFIIWDLMANDRIMRMLQNEADQGATKAFTANEMMNMLHQAIFVNIAQPDVMQRSMQKSMVDALITAGASNEGVKINKSLTSEPMASIEPIESIVPIAPIAPIKSIKPTCFLCQEENSLSSRPRDINFTSTQISRTSDAISIKRAELLRIRQFAKSRIGACTTAQQMHFADIVQRIDTALGMNK